MELEVTFYCNDTDEELELVATVEVEPYKPAITWGSADNWAPGEGGTNINLITLNGEEWTGELSKASKQSLEDAIESAMIDAMELQDESDYDDDYYDGNYDGREAEWESRE